MTLERLGSAIKRHRKKGGKSTATEDGHRLSFSKKSASSRSGKAKSDKTTTRLLQPKQDTGDLSLVQFTNTLSPESERTAWTEYCEAVSRGEHICPSPRGLNRLSSYFENQLPKISDRWSSHSSKKTEPARIPMDWFRSSLDLFQKQDGHHHSEMDSRYPMVLITGLPAVGKSAVARELANLLEGSHDRFAQGNKTRPSAREAAWTFFVDPRRRPRPGLLRSPGPTGCRRRACSSPVEYFADGKAIVVNVDHLSCMEDLRENQKSDTSEKGATAADSATQTASEVRWYCNSLASLQPGFQAAPETIRRLDRGRRLAMERYVMPKETKESSIILTECLYDDDRNGKSETAAAAYKTAATVFQRRLIPIYLTCELSEHQRRFKCRQRDAAEILRDIQDPAKTLNIPENDITALTPDQGLDKASAFFKHQAKAEGSLYIFSKPADYKDGRFSVPAKTRVGDFEQIDLPSEYQGCRIDTTGLTPLEVAGIIQKFCQDVMRGRPLQTWEGWKKDKTPEGDGGDKKQKSRSKTECLFIN